MPHLVEIQDAEQIVADDLRAILGWTCVPAPAPDDLGDDLPLAVVEKTGGLAQTDVSDLHALSIDVWAGSAGDWSDAKLAAIECENAIQSIEVGGVYKSIDITTQEYENPDPEHADIPRYTFAVDVVMRGNQL